MGILDFIFSFIFNFVAVVLVWNTFNGITSVITSGVISKKCFWDEN